MGHFIQGVAQIALGFLLALFILEMIVRVFKPRISSLEDEDEFGED